MENRLKTTLGIVASLFIAFSASAQDDPSRETVIVNPFTHSGAVNTAVTNNVRAAVLSGISARGRFHIVDAMTDGIMSQLYNGRSAEEVVNDANWKTESEAAYKALGADKLIIGQVNNLSYSTTKSVLDGSNMAQADVTFSLKVYNIADGAMIASEDIAVMGLDANNTRDGAFNDAMSDITTRMTKFVDDHFKFETYILELYISGGSEMGVERRTRFKVFSERTVGTRAMRSEIGTIVAQEVSEGVTMCEVSRGGDVIKEKFNNGETLIVVLDRQGTPTGEVLRGFIR